MRNEETNIPATQSLWKKTFHMPERKALDQDLKTDVAIIGAGMAGVLTGCLLKKHGINPVILEARRTGSGQTSNTTAKITSQHGLIYDKLISRFGKEKAQMYANANQEAIEQYQSLIEDLNIDCDFEKKRAYLFAKEDPDALKRETEAAVSLGIPASFVQTPDLPFPTVGAVCFEEQAQFHPLKFLKPAAENLTIYENSPVKTVEGQTLSVNGHTVTAEHIVFATHFPFINVPGYYFARMYQSRSYVLALENAQRVDGMYRDAREGGLSLRNYQDTLIFAGMDHRTGENSAGGRYEELRNLARQYYPDSREVACWSAQDCMTLDQAPYIGRFSADTPTWYAATGFEKWGMSSSMVAAMVLSDMIRGKENPNEEVFTPQRFNMASVPEFLKTSAQALKGLTREILTLPETLLQELPLGHGGVVDVDGLKAGVYKNEQGETYVVDVRCPHMGCQLEWNPDEKSWDCPCHGSRFNYQGNLIDNPAQENISHEKNL